MDLNEILEEGEYVERERWVREEAWVGILITLGSEESEAVVLD